VHGILSHASFISARSPQDKLWNSKTPQILELCRLSAVSPAQAIKVGDSPLDIHSARDAGIGLTVAVLSGGIKEEVLRAAAPDHILKDVSHLPHIFSQ